MPKVYVILGLVGVYFFLVFFNIAGEFLVNFAGFLIPGYYSLNALFTSSTQDDTQVSFFCELFLFTHKLLTLSFFALVVAHGMFT